MRFAFLPFVALVCMAAAPVPQKAAAHPAAKPPIETLFAQLAKAGSAEDAKPIEDQILATFEQSGSSECRSADGAWFCGAGGRR